MLSGFTLLLFTLLGIWLYFLPAHVAQGKENAGLIFFLKLFFGWTGLVWFALVIWAAVSPRRTC